MKRSQIARRVQAQYMKTQSVKLLGILLVLLVLVPGVRQAETQAETPKWQEKVPEVLQPWIPWVSRAEDNGDEHCLPHGTSLGGATNSQNRQMSAQVSGQRLCLWLSTLHLELGPKGGAARLSVQVDADETFVPLPGSSELFPVAAETETGSVPVLTHNGQPVVRLEKGQHSLRLVYLWDTLPASFPAPKNTAILSLRVLGEEIAFPKRLSDGAIWTQAFGATPLSPEVEQQSNRTELEVFRLLTDGIPQKLETIVVLRVSGAPRELRLSTATFPGKIYEVDGPLAVQVESDAIRLQLRAGNWTMTFRSWLEGLQTEFHTASEPSPWPEREIWALQTRPELRTVEFDGGTAISIEQTNTPRQWQEFPLVQLSDDQTLTVEEQRRGGTRAARDSLSLHKRLWLSFDAEEFDVRDDIQGTIAESGRLNYVGAGSLGRVSINGVDQYITSLDDTSAVGVEVREGSIQLTAESKRAKTSELKSSWDRDFDSASGTLTLPPGWSVFSAKGVDWVSQSWQKDWTLFDVFLVLLATVACYRLCSLLVGGVVGIMLVLVHPVNAAIAPLLLCLLALSALGAVLPKGKLYALARYGALLSAVGLTLTALVFSLGHIRTSMFPQLEHTFRPPSKTTSVETAAFNDLRDASAQQSTRVREAVAPRAAKSGLYFGSNYSADTAEKALDGSAQKRKSQYVLDTDKSMQTGFGLAAWSNQSISFGWNGPVQRDQHFGFSLLSPWQNFFLAVVRVLLLALVLVLVLQRYQGVLLRHADDPKASTSAANAVMLLVGIVQAALLSPLLLPSVTQAQNELPSQEILRDLEEFVRKERNKQDECVPNCVSIPLLHIDDAREGGLELRFSVQSAIETATPLLAVSELFYLRAVELDGQRANRLTEENGQLWLGVPKGVSEVRVLLDVGQTDEFGVKFVLRPKRIEIDSRVWGADNLRKGVLSGATLSLRKRASSKSLEPNREKVAEASTKNAPESRLAQLYQLERNIQLGVNWTVESTLTRLSPTKGSQQVKIPLLEGEALTSAGFEVRKGNVHVVLPSGQREVRWESILAQGDALTLAAAKEVPWSEIWRVNATNLWHVSYEGTPRIYTSESSQSGIPEWHPRSGEELRISVTQPNVVKGPTSTVDSVHQQYTLGERLQEVRLGYSLRSSKGGVQVLTLPKDAELTSVQIDNRPRPLRADGGKVKIDLTPGEQEVSLRWRQASQITTRFENEAVDFGMPAANVETEVTVPQDRWILFLSGPTIGPVVLFWAAVPICFLVAFILSRWPKSPLRMYEWLLLFLGLSQVPLHYNFILVAWFVLFALRMQNTPSYERRWRFRFQQILLAGLTLATINVLVKAIRQGLLSSPQMKIQGLLSGPYNFYWFQDSIDAVLPRVQIYSVDQFWYRAVMLCWALWLSFAAIRWLRWGWQSYSAGGYWIPLEFSKKKRNAKEQTPVSDSAKESSSTQEPE